MVFQNPNTLVSAAESDSACFEISCIEASAILAELDSAAEITTQLYCLLELDPQFFAKSKGRQKVRTSQTWSLNAILYGPVALEETVGDFLSKRRVYLQDPIGCDRNVPYQNPHILPPETEDVIMTGSLEKMPGSVEIEQLEVGPDLLAQLMENEDPLDETDAPAGVTTPLFRQATLSALFCSILGILMSSKVIKSRP
jgi:SWI/SNF-related matrix-associated actin-dependent regulator of chromatin subfamily A3